MVGDLERSLESKFFVLLVHVFFSGFPDSNSLFGDLGPNVENYPEIEKWHWKQKSQLTF